MAIQKTPSTGHEDPVGPRIPAPMAPRRLQATMTHCARILTIGLAAVTVGCDGLLPHLSKNGRANRSTSETAEHPRWNQVRGRVKYQLARQQYEAGLFDEAVGTTAESIALDPTNPEAYAVLAKADLELGKPASAQRALEAAEHAGVSSPDLTYLQGVLLEQRDRLEAAVVKYAEARTLDQTNADYPVAQAECLVALDRPVEALALLDDVTSGSGRLDDGGTISVLAGHVAALMGDKEGAARRYREALVSAGDSPAKIMLAEELGLLLARSGSCDEALSTLVPILAKVDGLPGTDSSGRIRRAAASCYLALNDPASARRILVEYASHHPTDTLAQLLFAKAAIGTDDLMTAMGALALAEQSESQHSEVKLVRAAVQWKRGDWAGATASLDDVLANTPDDVEAHCLMAEVLLARNEPDVAHTHLKRALEIDPSCAWAAAALDSSG